ncbi:UAA transporter family domain-containing protein [Ditylenchus destructor]|uniref:UAA transporter family domain-containing protein n=1 Tax=Ditylenchus destructor TaxID=166010 RepID=A0AAD4MXL1_9BILA|nr:UAA transporter family domain-containing protein [Ditylenchus destructor]
MSVAIAGTLSGCMSCMVLVESLAKEQPAAMNLVTFSTFLFIALEGLIVTTGFFTIPNRIPLRAFIPVVLTFFAVNVINNQALNFHVPVPLHIIFRSGSLLTSLIMNRLLLGRQYTLKKYLSVLAITVGIILCTLATSFMQKATESSFTLEEAEKHYKEWVIGIVMLTFALLVSSYLAICQERLYANHGRHPREAMFYVHSLSLPMFAFMSVDIWNSALEFSQAPPFEVFGMQPFGDYVSHLWVKLLGYCVMQWLCILFVYRLNSEVDSLTVTLVVTLRKFLSLIVSIIWFQNPFTWLHWIGAALVFGGTLVFSDVGFRRTRPHNE